jgi:membrane protease YdiL (CAAX protease family)
LAGQRRLALGLAVVVASMLALFTVPRGYFVAATFASTACMMVVAIALGEFKPAKRLGFAAIGAGLGSAILLYLVFIVGGWAVASLHPFGITSASETPIYSLISSPSNPLGLQVAILLFDSAGYESFFRGVIQNRLSARMGVMAAPAVAILDAALHVATLNPLWVGATFVTDLFWGLTYHYGGGTQASFTSHFVWDLAIFMVRPIM